MVSGPADVPRHRHSTRHSSKAINRLTTVIRDATTTAKRMGVRATAVCIPLHVDVVRVRTPRHITAVARIDVHIASIVIAGRLVDAEAMRSSKVQHPAIL